MSSRAKNILIVVLIIAIPILIVASFRADSVRNHVGALSRFQGGLEGSSLSIPSRVMLRLVYETPPEMDSFDVEAIYKFHEDALVRLGYLERREFTLTNWTTADFSNQQLMREFYGTLREILLSEPNEVKIGSFAPRPSLPGILVSVRSSEMPKFEEKIRELDAKRIVEIP